MKRFFPFSGLREASAWKLTGDASISATVLGGRDRIAEGRVHHDNPALGRPNIDVVDADAGAADDAEPLGRGDDFSVTLSPSGRQGRHSRRSGRGFRPAEIGQADRDAAIPEDPHGGLESLSETGEGGHWCQGGQTKRAHAV
jgi:hypothetical protein